MRTLKAAPGWMQDRWDEVQEAISNQGPPQHVRTVTIERLEVRRGATPEKAVYRLKCRSIRCYHVRLTLPVQRSGGGQDKRVEWLAAQLAEAGIIRPIWFLTGSPTGLPLVEVHLFSEPRMVNGLKVEWRLRPCADH